MFANHPANNIVTVEIKINGQGSQKFTSLLQKSPIQVWLFSKNKSHDIVNGIRSMAGLSVFFLKKIMSRGQKSNAQTGRFPKKRQAITLACDGASATIDRHKHHDAYINIYMNTYTYVNIHM